LCRFYPLGDSFRAWLEFFNNILPSPRKQTHPQTQEEATVKQRLFAMSRWSREHAQIAGVKLGCTIARRQCASANAERSARQAALRRTRPTAESGAHVYAVNEEKPEFIRFINPAICAWQINLRACHAKEVLMSKRA